MTIYAAETETVTIASFFPHFECVCPLSKTALESEQGKRVTGL